MTVFESRYRSCDDDGFLKYSTFARLAFLVSIK